MKPRLAPTVLWLSAWTIIAPLPAFATQGHLQPEGLYAHQMAHVFFMFSMGLLMYWLRKRRLVQETGWRYIQFASFFFILWNADAFLVHFIEEQTKILTIVRLNPWHLSIQAAEGFQWLVYIYFLAKLDHLLCVPALFFLFIGLKRLLGTGRGRMKMTMPSLPIWVVDVVGSMCMILLSISCLYIAGKLHHRDRNNIVWTYLFWVCTALTVFAVSRSAGHILKQILIIGDHADAWESIRPYSGTVNTFTFVVVASFTLFFERTWNIYQQITNDKQDLQTAKNKLLYLNQNLENLVSERTAELALSEHKYRRIFEVSRDLILVAGKDGRIVDINPSGSQMLRVDDIEVQNRYLQNFFLELSEWQSIADTIESKGFVANAEIDLKRSDGRRIRALLSGSLDRGFPDKEDTIHFLIKDIEQRRLAEEQIAQADKLASIGQLSAGIAHEINNPLGIILGFTQLLIRHEDPKSEKYQDLKTIEKHVRNCKTIVEDLLNFARTSSPNENLVRIDTALDDVLKFIHQHGDRDRIEVVKNYAPEVPQMFLDEKKIKQVFMNLLLNARHAIGNEGHLSLSTEYRPEGRKVVIKIADTGYGIEKRNLSRIFDPFFTTKPTGEGTGLGLSVSYGIIKNHGGDITVDSEVGRGATFTIMLPVVSPDKGRHLAEKHTDRR